MLFILAGYIIHFCNGLTTLRRCGGMHKFFYTFTCYFLLIIINLVGFPLFLGFFFKEYILYQVFNHLWVMRLVLITFLLSFGMTFFYLYKLYFYLFFANIKLWYGLSGFVLSPQTLVVRELLFKYNNSALSMSAALNYLLFWCVLFLVGGGFFYVAQYTNILNNTVIVQLLSGDTRWFYYHYYLFLMYYKLYFYYFVAYYLIIFYLMASVRYFFNSRVLTRALQVSSIILILCFWGFFIGFNWYFTSCTFGLLWGGCKVYYYLILRPQYRRWIY